MRFIKVFRKTKILNAIVYNDRVDTSSHLGFNSAHNQDDFTFKKYPKSESQGFCSDEDYNFSSMSSNQSHFYFPTNYKQLVKGLSEWSRTGQEKYLENFKELIPLIISYNQIFKLQDYEINPYTFNKLLDVKYVLLNLANYEGINAFVCA